MATHKINPRHKRTRTEIASEFPKPFSILARHLMTTNITLIGPEMEINDIAKILSELKISGVPVIEGDTVVGMVTEGDLIRRRELGTDTGSRDSKVHKSNADIAKSHGGTARDVMSTRIHAVREETPLVEIAEILQSRAIKRVLVLRDETLLGIVSRSDIVKALADRPKGADEPVTSDDDIIRLRVLDKLMDIPGTSPWFAKVNVIKGAVTLEGLILDEDQRDPSSAAISCLPHVCRVIDERVILQPY